VNGARNLRAEDCWEGAAWHRETPAVETVGAGARDQARSRRCFKQHGQFPLYRPRDSVAISGRKPVEHEFLDVDLEPRTAAPRAASTQGAAPIAP